MKKIYLAALLLLAVSTGMAQKDSSKSSKVFSTGFTFGVGLFTESPTIFDVSAGLQFEYKPVQGFSLYSQLTYHRWFGGGNSIGIGSLLVGPRAWFSEKAFVGMGAGLAYYTGNGASGTIFNFNPHVGISSKSAEFTLGYNGLSKEGYGSGFIELRAVANF